MALQFFWIAIFLRLVYTSSSLSVDSRVQGCSLVGMDLRNCLVPSTQQTPFSNIASCCATLNLILGAGYYCLCTLLAPSGNYPVFSAQLELSFSNCYLSVPPLTHCHVSEPKPIALAPPTAAMPLLTEPPPPPPPPLPPSDPLMSVFTPPDLARGQGFVPLPPKVNEIPLSENSSSSIVDANPIPNSSPLPMIVIPERWGYVRSDSAKVKMLANSRNLLILVSLWLYCMGRLN